MPNLLNIRESCAATIFESSAEDEAQDRLVGDFRGFVRDSVSMEDVILEIGPSYGPVFPKALGYNVEVVDHADKEGIQDKYKAMGMDVVVDQVDHVWKGGPISALTGPGRFKFVFCSHVVEHMTDLVAFLKDGIDLLSDDGTLVMIVPDMRYCFDLLQPITDSAKVLADHFGRRTRHSFEAFYREDAHVLIRHDDEWLLAWNQRPVVELKLKDAHLQRRVDSGLESSRLGDYVDVHEYFFTPNSFRLIIYELNQLGLLDCSIELLTRARGCEFLVSIRRGRAAVDDAQTYMAERKRISLLVMREQVEAWSPIVAQLA